jgi:hypothetical protein
MAQLVWLFMKSKRPGCTTLGGVVGGAGTGVGSGAGVGPPPPGELIITVWVGAVGEFTTTKVLLHPAATTATDAMNMTNNFLTIAVLLGTLSASTLYGLHQI